MTEISKITDYIIEKAQNEADEIIKTANEQYDKAMKEAEAIAAQKEDGIIKNAEAQAVKIKEMAENSANQEKKKRLLLLKNKAVKRILSDAKNIIYNMSDDDYMNLAARSILRYATGGSGIILFNAKDKKRINDAVKNIAADCNLKISDDTVNIDGGFVLKYGAVEENCSIEAIFREKEEEFTDYINENLFR